MCLLGDWKKPTKDIEMVPKNGIEVRGHLRLNEENKKKVGSSKSYNLSMSFQVPASTNSLSECTNCFVELPVLKWGRKGERNFCFTFLYFTG